MLEPGEIAIIIKKGVENPFKEGERVMWCEGLFGVVLGTFHSLTLVKTDDGINRIAACEFLKPLH